MLVMQNTLNKLDFCISGICVVSECQDYDLMYVSALSFLKAPDEIEENSDYNFSHSRK